MENARLWLSGSGAASGQLDEFFAQRLSLPASKIDPVAALSLDAADDIEEEERPGLATVIGLGLREI